MAEDGYELRIVRETHAQLKAREDELAKAVDELDRVRAARIDVEKALARIERRAGTEPTVKPAAKSAAKTAPFPGPGTAAATVYERLVLEGRMTVGVLTSRTGLPSNYVNTALQRLRDRGMVRRVSEGTYEPVSVDEPA